MPVKQTVRATRNPYKPRTLVDDVAFTIGAETGGNTKAVGVQLKDYKGSNIAHRACVKMYLSDDANGDSVIAVASSGAVAIGTDGLLGVVEAKKQFSLTTEANGHADFTIVEAGAKTLYAIVVLPDGRLKPSAAITFV